MKYDYLRNHSIMLQIIAFNEKLNNRNSTLNYMFSMLMQNQNETNVIAIFHLRTSNLRRLGRPCAYERPRQWPHCSRALDIAVDEVSDKHARI